MITKITKQIQKNSAPTGFTLIEILVVIGLIALLAAVVLIAVNPARQFAQGRNAQRISNVETILNAIGQRIADHKGLFRETSEPVCLSTMDIPASAVDLGTAVQICKNGTAVTACPAASVDMRPCLVTDYVAELPVDPAKGINACTDAVCNEGYDTAYITYRDSNNRITVAVPAANQELGQNIFIIR